MARDDKKTCFVIMPFGEKPDVDGTILDFDKVHNYIIKEAIEGMGIKCVRCDEISKAGWIHADMFDYIHQAEVAVVDITTLNANVFYELGVRHALRDSVTVLIRKKGTRIPFDLQGFRVIDYGEDMPDVHQAKKEIAQFVENGLKLRHSDSPVHHALDLETGTTPEPLKKCEVFEYRLRENPEKRICLITGDIQNVKIADIWVNSENTNMQMARFYDKSVSSVVRYLGARKDQAGQVIEDTVAGELAQIMGDRTHVDATTVIATGSGELEKTNKVKKIFHAASVSGEIGQGYRPIENIGGCVTAALKKADSPDFSDQGLKSILFPLMGTGTGKGSLPDNAKKLLEAAISYLEANPDSTIQRVYFLTWTDQELETCRSLLDKADEAEPVP